MKWMELDLDAESTEQEEIEIEEEEIDTADDYNEEDWSEDYEPRTLTEEDHDAYEEWYQRVVAPQRRAAGIKVESKEEHAARMREWDEEE